MSNIRRTKSTNLNDSLSSRSHICPLHWGQVLSREWICSWSSADRRCSNYIWVINNLIAYYVRLILETWRYFIFTKYCTLLCVDVVLTLPMCISQRMLWYTNINMGICIYVYMHNCIYIHVLCNGWVTLHVFLGIFPYHFVGLNIARDFICSE